jgi:hypothetical protein
MESDGAQPARSDATSQVRVPFNHTIETSALRRDQVLVDELARQHVARMLAGQLLAHSGVIGVYGSWGSGKSFLLDLTIKQLFEGAADRPYRPIVCYFQPWRYEPDTSLAPGLIKALGQVSEQFPGLNPGFPEERARWIREAAGGLLHMTRRVVGVIGPVASVAAAALAPIPAIPAIMVAKSVAGAVDAAAQASRPDGRPDLISDWEPDAIRSEMAKLIGDMRDAAKREKGEEWRSAEDYRVVVVIDDLDRCAPDLMVEMLNWLKVHLTVPGCSYLLALDHGAAARAIVGKYRAYLGASTDIAYGLRYLEKIVDFEVELGESRLVEQMAARAVGKVVAAVGHADSVTDIIERLIRRQGVRSAETSRLMRLPTLQSPRTMLKVISRYTSVLGEIQRDRDRPAATRAEVRQLPADYSFWLLLLVAMYYRLAPWQIEAFCHGAGPLVDEDDAEPENGDTSGGPLAEFRDYLATVLRDHSGKSTQPVPAVLLYLYAVVRQFAVTAE